MSLSQVNPISIDSSFDLTRAIQISFDPLVHIRVIDISYCAVGHLRGAKYHSPPTCPPLYTIHYTGPPIETLTAAYFVRCCQNQNAGSAGDNMNTVVGGKVGCCRTVFSSYAHTGCWLVVYCITIVSIFKLQFIRVLVDTNPQECPNNVVLHRKSLAKFGSIFCEPLFSIFTDNIFKK